MNDKMLMLDFNSPCDRYRLTFEDDGKVAYAYLKTGGNILGDVWLYNRCRAPDAPEWSDPRKIPFANAAEFTSEGGRMRSEILNTNVKVDWEYADGSPVAYVYILDDLYGVVGVGDKPGYARFAAKDGPIARVMEIDGD